MTALSAKLADDPGKVRRILEIIDFGRKFYPPEQQKPEKRISTGFTAMREPGTKSWTALRHPPRGKRGWLPSTI